MNLVFASGFLFPQHLLKLDYFRGLKAHLAGRHAALFPEVPPVGDSEERARALAEAIHQAFPEGPVHIIAHSMGGLDGRTLIARNHRGLSAPGRIASLTTLSTPHRGSPVADLLAGPRPDSLQRLLVLNTITQVIDLLGVPSGALENLTSECAARVPDVRATHPHIRYRSYFAAGRAGARPTCFILSPTHHYILGVTGEANDGLVTLSSARYGEFQEPHWPCDHVDMVGHNLDSADLGEFQFDHFTHIDAIISKLEQA
jgi:triacylglycerol lipase